MHDWNVVVTVYEDGYKQARNLLQPFGAVSRTEFYNVLVMKVDDVDRFVERLRELIERDAQIVNAASHIMPVRQTFMFQDPEQFEAKAREAAEGWLSDLAGKAFHVRMHRRGFKGRLSSQSEERFLDDFLLQALEKAGTPGRITFEDPDAILVVETVGQSAGMSLWSRADLERYVFLRLD